MENERVILFNTIKALVNELVDSSSTSTDDEMEILTGLKTLPKVKRFAEDVVSAYSDAEFKHNFHISRKLSQYLIAKYSASSWHVTRNYKGGRLQTPTETQMLSFLWFAANKTNFREVANLFGMSISTIHDTFNKVLNFLVNDIAPDAIRFPKEIHEKEIIAKEFENIAGFPNVLGCIAGIFIKSRKSKSKITRKKRPACESITLQGICDANLRFLDVFTGVPNKIHEAIEHDLSSACAPHYHFLGDSAYPLTEYLLTPYQDYESFTEAGGVYNTKLYQTRATIENAYILLKMRFSQLSRLDFYNAKSMEKFVIACCALHNLCIERNDLLDFTETDITNVETQNNSAENDVSTEQLCTQWGELKRHDIRNQLYSYRFHTVKGCLFSNQH